MDKKEYNEICIKFDTFYKDELKQVTKEIDRNELELKGLDFDNMIEASSDHNLAMMDKEVLSSLAVEWQLLCDVDIDDNKDDNIKCIRISNCISCKKVNFILNLFDKSFLNKYIFEEKQERCCKEALATCVPLVWCGKYRK